MVIKNRVFYKYRPFDIYSIRIIMMKQIYFARNEQFNDPFDSNLIYLKSGSTENGISYKIRNKISDELGVFCLTKKKGDILMFSHYAQNHTGVCFIFDFNKIPRESELFKIKYSENMQLIKDENKSSEYINCLITKSIHWKYENEYRIIKFFQNNDSRLINLVKRNLKGIILGYKMSEINKEFIKHLAKEVNLKVYQAKKVNNKFKLTIEKVK